MLVPPFQPIDIIGGVHYINLALGNRQLSLLATTYSVKTALIIALNISSITFLLSKQQIYQYSFIAHRLSLVKSAILLHMHTASRDVSAEAK